MRKAVVLTLLLLLPIAAFADNVPEQKARAVAERFFGLAPQTKAEGNGLSLVWNGETPTTKATPADEPAFYVYTYDKGGYIIISGDDIATPVLAYSRDSEFTLEGMPDHVASWFGVLREAIYEAREKGYQPTEKTLAAWNGIESSGKITAGKPVTIYNTALWDQEYPYNSLCPKDRNANSYTGCAATAQAIVLRHHGYPAHGYGTIPEYTTDTKKITVPENNVSEHYYDWDNMPLKYDKNWTEEQKEEVAQIMFDCGSSLNMDYSNNGSGAVASAYRPSLIKYFGISPDVYAISADAYSTDQWIEKIKRELDAVGPIIYTGFDRFHGGHAFVLDGYDSDNLLHINFGWSGIGNAYCAFPTFKTSGYNFSVDHVAIFNLVPAESGETGEDVVWMQKDGSKDLFVSNTDSYTVGNYFNVTAYNIHWSSIDESNFEIAVAHCDFFGKVKEIVGAAKEIKLSSDYSYPTLTFYNCRISEDIEYLDKLILVYRFNKGEWKAVICPHAEGIADEISLTEKGIDASTSFEYNKQTLTITIKTLSAVKATLEDSSGNLVTSGINNKSGVVTIDTTAFPAGEYSLTLSKGTDKKTITFTTGE